MDPTEIIDIPLSTPRLLLLVVPILLPLLVEAVVVGNGGHHGITTLSRLVQWTLTLFAAMILCGASPTHTLGPTALAALYLASLLGWDPLVGLGDWHPLLLLVDDPRRRREVPHHQDDHNHKATHTTSSSSLVRMQATLGMTIVFQILLLYDRGWQVQRWPLPTLLGSTIGWTLGVVLEMILSFLE